VVVVEDNPTDVFLVREAMTAHGLDVVLEICEDGQEAIDFIVSLEEDESEPCPELILLDINLPKTDGFEVLGRLRESRRCGSIPVIVMTSSPAPSDRDRSAALGAKAYFQKPPHYNDFLRIGELVRAHLK
jgi:CheY-like chemotaxis protein